MDFRILGSLEVLDDEGRELALGAGRQRAILALLLLRAGKVVSRETLVDELWGTDAPPTVTKIVQNHVSRLRRALGDGRLVTRGRGYVLELEPGTLDLECFESLAAEGSSALARGDAETASKKLREALALWRGSPLAEFAHEAFAEVPIARLEALRLEVTEERVEAELALGLAAELVGELEELVRQNPLRERPRALLMLALYRSGRQAEALETYRSARALLVGQLGLEPGEELQQLQRAILAHDPQLAPPARRSPGVGTAAAAAAARRVGRPLVLVGLVLTIAAGAATVALAFAGGSARPLVVGGDSLALVDPRAGRVVDRIPVGPQPGPLALGAESAWVANDGDGTVSRIDRKTRRTIATIHTGAPASDIAVGEGSVWVVNASYGTLARIDPQTNAVVDTVDLGRPAKLAPEGLFTVTTAAGAVWVGSGAGRLLKIDPQRNEVLASIDVGLTPVDVVASNGELWVAHVGGRVLRIDARTGRLTGSVPVAPYARALAAGEGGVWVTDAPREGGGLVWRVEPGNVIVSSPPARLAHAPAGIATGEGAVWVAGGPSGMLIRIDPQSGRVVGSIRVGNIPLDVASADGLVWVTVAGHPAAT